MLACRPNEALQPTAAQGGFPGHSVSLGPWRLNWVVRRDRLRMKLLVMIKWPLRSMIALSLFAIGSCSPWAGHRPGAAEPAVENQSAPQAEESDVVSWTAFSDLPDG